MIALPGGLGAMPPTRRYLILGAAFLMSIFIATQVFFGPRQTVEVAKHTTQTILKSVQQSLTATESIKALWSSIRLPITARTFTDATGKQFNVTAKQHWTKPLGKDLLVIDIDTRQPTGYNQILNGTKIDWEKFGDGTYMDDNIGLTSEAIFNHYLYSQIHGYDYLFYQAEEIGYQHHTWVKVHAIAEVLPNYKFVVFLDADVTIHHMEVPIEWLLNKWKFGPQTSLGLAQDVTREDCNTCDSKGNVMLSSGVVIAQNLPHTHTVLEAWRTCTNETRYKGCGEWAWSWAHEQRAISEYIRYDEDMNPDQNIIALPCDDTNGYPEKNDVKDDYMTFYSDCQGNFFQHHWLQGGKRLAKKAIGDAIMQSVAEVVQKSLWEGTDHLVLNKTRHPGDHVSER